MQNFSAIRPVVRRLFQRNSLGGDPPLHWRGLTLARTSYFAILDRTRSGWLPSLRLVCPLIEIELRIKHKRKERDILILTIPDFTRTTLGHILPFQGRSNKKCCFFEKIKFLANNFSEGWRKMRNTIVFLFVKMHGNM